MRSTRFRGPDRSECLICHQIKPHSQMVANGRDGRCKQCNNHRDLVVRYGISLDEYNQLLERQGGVCAICHTRPHYRLHVDHAHDTHRVRGLLCRRCNIALGIVERQPQFLESAILYLTGTTPAAPTV